MTSADLIFDPASHTYRLPDGPVPSVTSILSAVRVSTDFEEISSFSRRRAEQIDRKRQIGSAVHADCHAYDDDDLDLADVPAEWRPYVEAWAQFRADKGLIPVERERMVLHPRLRYCGTLDGVFRGADADSLWRVLVDIKIGDPDDAGAQFQTAAYAHAWAAESGCFPTCERWSVRLTPERRIPYRIKPYTDPTDFPRFCAFLTTYHAQACRRIRREHS